MEPQKVPLTNIVVPCFIFKLKLGTSEKFVREYHHTGCQCVMYAYKYKDQCWRHARYMMSSPLITIVQVLALLRSVLTLATGEDRPNTSLIRPGTSLIYLGTHSTLLRTAVPYGTCMVCPENGTAVLFVV